STNSNGSGQCSVSEARAPHGATASEIDIPPRDSAPLFESAQQPLVNALTASRSWRPKDRTAFAVALFALLTGAIFLYERSLARSNKGLTSNHETGAGRLAMPLAVEKLTDAGQSGHVAISRDGRYIAYTIGSTMIQSIWLRQLSTNTNVQIVPPGPIYGLGFAANGEYLYFVKGDPRVLYRVALVGGVPTRIVDNLEGNFSLSADDTQIAFIREAINP